MIGLVTPEAESMSRPILALGVLGLLAGCTRPDVGPPAPDSTTVSAARAAANELGAHLQGMLLAALREGGPTAAIAVCADSAQTRTARHQSRGVSVRRVGTRVRNPANRPDSIETAVLTAFAARAGAPPADTAFVHRAPDGTWQLHYLRPVVISEPCLVCHGDAAAIPASVRQVLEARYPADRATGYSAGDLRGAVSVRVRLPEQRQE